MRRMVLPVSIALALLARVSHPISPLNVRISFFREQGHHPCPKLASSVLEGF